MFSKNGSVEPKSRLLLSSTAVFALFSGLIALGAGSALKAIQSAPGVEVNVSELTWWRGIQLIPDAIPHELAQLNVPEIFVRATPVRRAGSAAIRTTRKASSRHHAVAHHRVVRHLASNAVAPTRTSHPLARAVSDRLHVSHAAQERAVQSPVAQAPEVSAAEAQRMRDIRNLLRGRFLVAMSDQAAKPSTAVAAALTTHAVPSPRRTARVAVTVQAHPAKKAHLKHLAKAPVKPARPALRALNFASRVGQSSHLVSIHQLKADSKGVAATPKARNAVTKSVVRMATQVASVSSQVPIQAPPGHQTSPPVQRAPNDQITEHQSAPAPKPMGISMLIARTEIPPMRPVRQVTTQSHRPSVPTQPPRQEQPGQSEQPTTHSVHALMQTPDVSSAVEAFDWKTPVTINRTDLISAEGSPRAHQPKWIKTEADSHWPTLALQFEGEATALISNNSALMLGTLAGATLESHAGIIFGKLPKGWTVELSARAEHPVYLNSDAGARAFAFINVAPGAHLLYLATHRGEARVAIAVPVMESTATYADLTQRHSRGLQGRVLDGSSASAKAVANVTVRVIGQPDRSATTDQFGEFAISEVREIGNHPLYVETLEAGGYTHRYRVDTDERQAVTLFRFSPKQIMSWLGQLEGGISAESGLMLAAAPTLAAASSEQPLFPSMVPLLTGTTLIPESYTLSADDHLLVQKPLSAEMPRFLSVQIPEGGAIARLEDKASHEAWSQLVISSPGVVNVVGPY